MRVLWRAAAVAYLAAAVTSSAHLQSAEQRNHDQRNHDQRNPEQPSQYQVEAAFLLHFTRFVEWPASAFPSPSAPFTLCVLGDDPFEGALEQLVEGEAVNGRKLRVEHLRRPPAANACQILYVGAAEKDVAAVLSDVGPAVLTVSDRTGFLQDGGIIAFVIEDRHVRFDINLRAAVKASLTISARLLNVARSVQR